MSPLAESERFEQKLSGAKFLITLEVNPPRGTDLSETLNALAPLRGLVDAINVTDGSGANLRACPLAVAYKILETGLDPILQLTCRDRNRLALQADLLGAGILGIRNLLLLTGDDPKSGDHPEAKPVFDLTSAAFMQIAKGMTEGHDMMNHPLIGSTRFCIGAAADPGAKDLNVELQKFQAKISSGASFFQTQAVFETQPLSSFMEKAKAFKKPVLAGVLLVKSAKMARYMNEHVWGIHVPDSLIERFERSKDLKAECVEITAALIRQIRPIADGIHLYALGWEQLVPQILKEASVR
ncbi:MAG: methylenetetrahydrofolate reductase [Candidatus Omnitrophica bacterium]|nr:methylenetetrahydrofolate reductase [Candidatus Omnitrophota bacterium]